MKRVFQKVLLVGTFMLLVLNVFTSESMAAQEQKTIYNTGSVMDIFTRVGFATALVFPADVEVVVSGAGQESFFIEVVKNKVIIKPLMAKAITNLGVFIQNKQYSFRLVEDEYKEPDFIVNVRDGSNVNWAEYITAMVKDTLKLDALMRGDVTVVDVKPKQVRKSVSDKVEVEATLKRILTIKSLQKTILWFRIQTPSTNKAEVRLPLSTVSLKDHERIAVIGESDRLIFKPGTSADVFVVIEGTVVEPGYNLLVTADGSTIDIAFPNLEFEDKKYEVFTGVGEGYQFVIPIEEGQVNG